MKTAFTIVVPRLLAPLIPALAIAAAAIPLNVAGQLADNFSTDNGLNLNLWTTQSGFLTTLSSASSDPGSAFMSPLLTFSSSGMQMAGVNGTYQFTGIQSLQTFTPPFTLNTTVEGLIANANPFELYLVSSDLSQWLAIAGNINPNNDGYYGIWVNYTGNSQPLSSLGNDLYGAPGVGVWYSIQVSVGADGSATVSLLSGGTTLASQGGLQVGPGPFYLVLAQREGLPYTIGPNVAVWQSVSMTQGAQAPPSEIADVIYFTQTNVGVQHVLANGQVSLIASGPDYTGLAFDSDGSLYVASFGGGTITKFTPTGINSWSNSTFATGLAGPNGLAFDRSGNLYVANHGNGTITKITKTGLSSVFASGLNNPQSLNFDDRGNLYVCTYGNNAVVKCGGDGGSTVFAEGLRGPAGIVFNPVTGFLYATEYDGNSIIKLSLEGAASVFADANLSGPNGIAADSSGNLYVASHNNGTIRKFSPAGVGSLFASPGLFVGFVTVHSIVLNGSVSLSAPCVNGLQADINGGAAPGAAVTSIDWNWGDGQHTTGFFPQSHTYASAGLYYVQVTAHYNDGSSASTSKTVFVAPGVLSGCDSLTIIAGQGGSVSYQASVGSGTVPTGESVTLQLDFADDLSLTANPAFGGSFVNWFVSSGITIIEPSGTPDATTSPSIVIVVTGGSQIVANFFKDTTPPVINWLVATPNSLGIATNAMVPVPVTANTSDNVDPACVSSIVSVSSTQPTTDGADILITGPLTVQLRAKTLPGMPRIYTILVKTQDASGNWTTGTVNVYASLLPVRPR